MPKNSFDALDDCLERVRAGEDLEKVLALYPQWETELRPLLESVLKIRSLPFRGALPENALSQSRSRFIARATQKVAQRGIFKFNYHFNRTFITVFSVIVIIAITTSLVSAKSLPGDILYPVKLAGEQTRLMLTSNQTTRLNLEESFDSTRADEVESVLQKHRITQVNFAGLLTQPVQNQWRVANVDVTFSTALTSQFDGLMGDYVEIDGLTDGDGTVEVTQITATRAGYLGDG